MNLQQWAVHSGSEETVLVPGVGRSLWAGRRALLLVVMTGMTVSTIHIGAQTPPESTDAYQWLEDVSGQRSMAWVQAENERSAKVLEGDPRFAGLEAAALKVLESPDRLQN